jgi:pimeloyl-ACP methyl ester carboxylesterase
VPDSQLPDRLIYLFGIAGDVGVSPALQQLADEGCEIVIPSVPGFDGESGFVAPFEYLDWLATFWDSIDATGATPCPVVGASIGGMIAADLAALRPEAVTKLALLAPFGIADAANPGFDLYSTRSPERMPHLFAKGVPEAFLNRFAEKGEEEAPVAYYLSEIASASLTWPLGDRGLANRIHRIACPKTVLWGEQDELLPHGLIERWGGGDVIAGAGHLLEWDTPDEVATRLRAFLKV